MLDRLAAEIDVKGLYSSREFYLFYYTFLSPIMPRFLYEMLQRHISTLIDGLEGRKELPRCIDVPDMYRQDIIRVLRQWQEEAPAEYPARRLREQAFRGRQRDILQKSASYGITDEVPKGSEKQDAFYRRTGILMMSPAHDALLGKELSQILEAYRPFT